MNSIGTIEKQQDKHQSVEVIAFHGWGFDRHCWQFWQQQFGQLGYSFQAFDRGYFGDSYQPSFARTNSKNNLEDSTKIILAHSYGLHLCPGELLQQADILILFNSFLAFHPQEKAAKRRSQLLLQQMIRQFEQTPATVLQNFYLQSDHSSIQQNWHSIDRSLLLHDLNQLSHSRFNSSCLNKLAQIAVFQSVDDRIVAASQTQEFMIHLPRSCQLISSMHGGHALPLTHGPECWLKLQSVLSLPVTR